VQSPAHTVYSPPLNQVAIDIPKSKTPLIIGAVLGVVTLCAGYAYFVLLPKQAVISDDSQKHVAVKTVRRHDRIPSPPQATNLTAPPVFANNRALEYAARAQAERDERERQAQLEGEARVQQQREMAQKQQEEMLRQRANAQRQAVQAEIQRRKEIYIEQELPKLARAVDTYNKLLSDSVKKRERWSRSGAMISTVMSSNKDEDINFDNGGMDAKNALTLSREIKRHPLFRLHCIEGQKAYRYLPNADMDFLDSVNPEVIEVAELRFIKIGLH